MLCFAPDLCFRLTFRSGRTNPVSCTANRSADGTATCCRSGEGRGRAEGGASHVQVIGSGAHAEPFRPHGPLPFPSTTIGWVSRPFHARSDPRMNKSLLFGSRLGHRQPSLSTVVVVFAIRFDPNRSTVPRFVPPSVLCLVPSTNLDASATEFPLRDEDQVQ